MTEHSDIFKTFFTINSEVKISSLETLNYDLKSVILIYENSQCVLTKKVKKATDFASSVSSPKFLFPIYPSASKIEKKVESPNLHPYIKILQMSKKKLHFSYSKYSTALGNTGCLELKNMSRT